MYVQSVSFDGIQYFPILTSPPFINENRIRHAPSNATHVGIIAENLKV